MSDTEQDGVSREVPEPPRFVSHQPALVTHCTGCEEPVGLKRHILEIGDDCYAVCYDCAPLNLAEEPQQQKLITDGGVSEDAVIPCYACGGYYPESGMEAIDVSRDDEYYPRFIHVCAGCMRRERDTENSSGGDPDR